MKKTVRYTRTIVTDYIENYIAQNKLKTNDRLPSERKLSELLGVSRMTLRSAIDKLVDEGILYRKPGSGTFISPKKVTLNLGTLVSFKEIMRKQNLQFDTKVLDISIMESNKELSKVFQVNLGTEVIRLTRKRMVEKNPFLIETTYLLKSKVPGILETNFYKESLFDVLKDRFQIILNDQKHQILSSLPPGNFAKELEIDVDTPCLFLKSNILDENQDIVVYTNEWVRPDRCVLTSISREKD